EDGNRIENQELERSEEERDCPVPYHHGGHEAAHDHHWDDPESGYPAKPPVELHPPCRDEDVLQQVDPDPPHEEEGVDMHPKRRSESRSAHQILRRKAGDDRDGHDDCRAKEETLVACRRRKRLSCYCGHQLPP